MTTCFKTPYVLFLIKTIHFDISEKTHIHLISCPFLHANYGLDFQHIQSLNRDQHFPWQQDVNHHFLKATGTACHSVMKS